MVAMSLWTREEARGGVYLEMDRASLAKTLSARNIPAGDAVRSIRGIENDFAQDVFDTYAARLAEIADAKDVADVLGSIGSLIDAFRSELISTAVTHMRDAYEAGGKAVYDRFTVEQTDEALLESLISDPNGIAVALDAFALENRQALENIAAAASVEGLFDPEIWLEGIEEQLDVASNKFDMIARTETTRAANWARAKAEEELGRELDLYEWVTAEDDRVCVLCKEVRDEGPMTLEDLRKRTNNFLVHPYDRCTIRRVGS